MAMSSRSPFLVLFLLPILLAAAAVAAADTSPAAPSDAEAKSLCLAAPYPDLCRESTSLLSAHVTHDLTALVRAAVAHSLNSAVAASVHVKNSIGSSTELSCERSMADAVDVLRLAVKELERLGRGLAREQYGRCLATVQALVSTAAADAKSCLKELTEKPRGVLVSDTVNVKVARAMQLSSNALVFVEKLRPPPEH